MKKVIIFLFLPFLLLACQSEREKVSADSMLFTIENDRFTAELTHGNANATGEAEGPTLWQRSGPLSVILSDLYEKPVEIENGPLRGQNYKLDIAWSESVSLGEIRDEVTSAIKEELGYSIVTENRTQPKYILALGDPSILQQETDFANEGTLTRVSLKREGWRIYAPLDEFSEILGEQTDRRIELENNYGSTAYYFELTETGGFDEIAGQLQEKYDMTFQEERVQVEYLTMVFN